MNPIFGPCEPFFFCEGQVPKCAGTGRASSEQVTRDYAHGLDDAADPEAIDPKAWQCWGEVALERLSGVGEESNLQIAQKPSKLRRLAAYDWAVSLDHQLQVVGRGLKDFEEVEDENGKLKNINPDNPPPCLVVNMDEGSDGFCAMWYLINQKRLRCFFYFDPCHRAANDAKLGLWGAGFGSTVMLTFPQGQQQSILGRVALS